MNARECAIAFKNSRGTINPITIRELSGIHAVPRRDIAREYRRLLKNET